jgi:hypothetical protein
MNWINLTQDRDQWWTLVNTLMDFRGPIKCRKTYCRHHLVASGNQECTCSNKEMRECFDSCR